MSNKWQVAGLKFTASEVGVQFIEPVRKLEKQHGADKSAPCIKNNILNEIVLNFELWLLAFRFKFLA